MRTLPENDGAAAPSCCYLRLRSNRVGLPGHRGGQRWPKASGAMLIHKTKHLLLQEEPSLRSKN
ncbi:hypothetical protein ES703_66041 [subsurface metagenome]